MRCGMKHENIQLLIAGLMLALIFVSGFNSYQLAKVKSMPAPVVQQGSQQGASQQLSGVDILPKGVPDIYGKELGISFDDVSANNPNKADATIKKLGELDINIKLTPDQLKRYINILYTVENGISCEYCCGARAIIFETGEPACGCAHSYAMRGLAKYLITKHGQEYTDREILEEVGKWKTLFFPDIMSQKAAILKQNGIELNFINIASNKYRGAEKGAASGGSMVGGC